MFFTHAHKPKFWLSYLRIYFDLFLSLSFFSLPFFFISSFLPILSSCFLARNCGWPTFKERDKFNLQRVVGKQRNWQWIVPQHLTIFCECNGVRISQNIQNEVSLEIFADFVAYQLINLNWKLNGYKKENMHDHASFHMER